MSFGWVYLFRPNHPKRLHARFATVEQARDYCARPESSYKTATDPAGKRRTRRWGMWFFGYYTSRQRRR